MLTSLRKWHADAPAPPLHRRPLCFLHLRYWNLVILASRQFLLCSLLRREQLQQKSNSRSFEEFSDFCIGAAGQSLSIMQKMMEDHTLPSLLIADFRFVLDVIQTLLVAFEFWGCQGLIIKPASAYRCSMLWAHRVAASESSLKHCASSGNGAFWGR